MPNPSSTEYVSGIRGQFEVPQGSCTQNLFGFRFLKFRATNGNEMSEEIRRLISSKHRRAMKIEELERPDCHQNDNGYSDPRSKGDIQKCATCLIQREERYRENSTTQQLCGLRSPSPQNMSRQCTVRAHIPLGRALSNGCDSSVKIESLGLKQQQQHKNCLFSDVSTPTFASKQSFCNIFLHTEIYILHISR